MNNQTIKVTSGVHTYIGKTVTYNDEPYSEGDFIVCINKKNVNYGTVIKNKTMFGDFTDWKKILLDLKGKVLHKTYKVWLTIEEHIEYENGESVYNNIDEPTVSAGVFNSIEDAGKHMEEIHEVYKGDYTSK